MQNLYIISVAASLAIYTRTQQDCENIMSCIVTVHNTGKDTVSTCDLAVMLRLLIIPLHSEN